MAPIDCPSRTLNCAMDFLALVMIGFCPVIWLSSLAAGSSSLGFCVASPIPILTTILCKRGTAIGFFSCNSFCKAGAISLLNRSFSLVAISFSALFHGFGVPDGVYRFVKTLPGLKPTTHFSDGTAKAVPLQTYLSSTELHLRQMRTVLLPFFSWPRRTGPQVPQINI